MKKIIALFLIGLVLSGCFSQNIIGINTVKSYEGRFDKNSEIVLNGKKIELENDSVVWILRGETLSVLLSTAANQKVANVAVTATK